MSTRRSTERGYTLAEMMVAVAIAVFLLAGLFSILQQTRRTSNTTTGIAQLQDDERVAMTILTNTIQQAGYVPEASGSGNSKFIADTAFATAGQLVAGSTGVAGTIGDTIVVRYDLGANDTAFNCIGQLNGGSETVYEATIQLTTSGQLTCSPNTNLAALPLVNNLANLKFHYAVNTTSATSNTAANQLGPNTETTSTTLNTCPADTYIDTGTMSANDWTNICAVKVDLVFVNPLYQPAGQPQPTPGQLPYVTFERVIAIQKFSGINASIVTSPGSSSGSSSGSSGSSSGSSGSSSGV